jgi:Domain of unknown function (DUF4386)
MDTKNNSSRVLGVAFLLQFVTSICSGTVMRQAWLVPGDIGATMLNIANKPWLMDATILVDMLTALGIIFLGVVLFVNLREQNEKIAMTALGFYILEAALLAVSRIAAFALIGISQNYAVASSPAFLLMMGNLAFQSMDFVGSTLHMLVFCLGGILFYFLLVKSRVVPVALSLWGLIATFPMLIGTLIQIFGHSIPFIFYVPYVPFELVMAVWILVKGIKNGSEMKMVLEPSSN